MDVVVVEELSDGEGTVEEASGGGTDARLVVVADVSVPAPLVVGAVSWAVASHAARTRSCG